MKTANTPLFLAALSLMAASTTARSRSDKGLGQPVARAGTTQTIGNTVQIVVQSVRKACLRITLPNGAVSSPCYLKGTDMAYTLGPFTTAKYCWAPDVRPTRCDPPKSFDMQAGKVLKF